MQVRRLSELKRTQSQMLERFRADQAVAIDSAATPSEPAGLTVLIVGRVNSVVSTDPELGAHLVVIKQKADGQPPVFGDDSTSSQVYYPSPNRLVTDYSVSELVLCHQIEGARVALKIG